MMEAVAAVAGWEEMVVWFSALQALRQAGLEAAGSSGTGETMRTRMAVEAAEASVMRPAPQAGR